MFKEEVSRIQSTSVYLLNFNTACWNGSKNSNGESWRNASWFQAATQPLRVALPRGCLVCCCCLVAKSCLTPWTMAHQAPVSMAFSRQEYWSGLPFPSPGALPDPGAEPASSALAGRFFTVQPPGKPNCLVTVYYNSISLSWSSASFWTHVYSSVWIRVTWLLYTFHVKFCYCRKKKNKLCRDTM